MTRMMEVGSSAELPGELEAFDSLAENVGQTVVKNEFTKGQIVAITDDMVTMPTLPDGLSWQGHKNATKTRPALWQVVENTE